MWKGLLRQLFNPVRPQRKKRAYVSPFLCSPSPLNRETPREGTSHNQTCLLLSITLWLRPFTLSGGIWATAKLLHLQLLRFLHRRRPLRSQPQAWRAAITRVARPALHCCSLLRSASVWSSRTYGERYVHPLWMLITDSLEGSLLASSTASDIMPAIVRSVTARNLIRSTSRICPRPRGHTAGGEKRSL